MIRRTMGAIAGIAVTGCASLPADIVRSDRADTVRSDNSDNGKSPPSLASIDAGPTPLTGKPASRAENRAAVAHPKPAPPSNGLNAFVGVTELDAKALLGAPTAIADRAPALIWEYRARKCVLALHFYMDVNTRMYRVLTYDVTPKTVAESACVASVQDEGR